MGMAGVWNVTPAENRRMVEEKQAAAVEAGVAMTRAVLTGKGPVAVAEAGLAPVARKTRANAKRLSKRGMKVGN
ncbi:MAG: antifreeze protein, partial [Paracoccaceae bacterium]